MQDSAKTSSAAPAIAACFGVLALLFWVLALATLSDLAGSDAAGNGYAQAYAAIELFILWSLLALVTLIACVKGEVAWPAAFAAVILIPSSGVVAFVVLGLLSTPSLPPFLWPIVIPALVPPLVLAFDLWALFPSLRAAIPARLAGAVWGV